MVAAMFSQRWSGMKFFEKKKNRNIYKNKIAAFNSMQSKLNKYFFEKLKALYTLNYAFKKSKNTLTSSTLANLDGSQKLF